MLIKNDSLNNIIIPMTIYDYDYIYDYICTLFSQDRMISENLPFLFILFVLYSEVWCRSLQLDPHQSANDGIS